ncbi:DUF3108 domain-containing protein [Pseudomonas stutzeri]|nr:DUF3108 domain-containing protein [Stutzerimonas stutzeri]
MRRALPLVLALCGLPTAAQALEPFSARYTADWQQVPVSGSAERHLLKNADGTWTLQFKASMLVAGLSEESRFRHDGQRFVPLSYRFERSGLGKGKKITHDFDWQAKQVTGRDRNTPVSLVLKSGLLDKSTYQLALQEDVAAGKKSMSYQVLDGDEIETYDFRVLGTESVRTEAGQIEAIKVERVRDPTQTSRKTVLWFARDWDHLLVRLHQVEKDGKEYQIMLKQGRVDGREVKGN